MELSFVQQLIEFLLSPLGVISAFGGIGLFIGAQRSPRIAWFIFSLCCFAASLSAFSDEYVITPPPLIFPLQQLRAMGRPLTLLLLGLTLIVGFQARENWRRYFFPTPI